MEENAQPIHEIVNCTVNLQVRGTEHNQAWLTIINSVLFRGVLFSGHHLLNYCRYVLVGVDTTVGEVLAYKSFWEKSLYIRP
jgi:hypothetical protein